MQGSSQSEAWAFGKPHRPFMTPRRRRSAIVATTTALLLLIATVALADQWTVDNDVFSPGNQNSVSLTSLPNATVNTSAQILVDYQGNNHLLASTSTTTRTVTFVDSGAGQTTLPSGYTLSSLVLTVPSNWGSAGAMQLAGSSNISFSAPSTPGSYSYVVKWTPTSFTCASGNCLTGGAAFNISLTVESPPPPTNSAPLIAADNASVTVDEGSTASNTGTWSDADAGDSVSLTASVGTVTKSGPNSGGTWSWSFNTTDGPDDSQTVTVTADDGTTTSSTTFSLVVNNVAPSVTADFSSTVVSCGPDNATLDVSFSDPGADTHVAQVDWNNDSTYDETIGAVTSPFSAPHTYGAAGMYTANVEVTDSDAASGTDTADVTVNYTIVGGGVQPPINANGTSVFKYGSTIPVKIKVQDCDGSYPDSLAPQIIAQKMNGATPTLDVNETTSTSGADTNGIMRFTGSPDYQYIYNLATKSLPDSMATYRMKITIPATGQVIYSANFGIRK